MVMPAQALLERLVSVFVAEMRGLRPVGGSSSRCATGMASGRAVKISMLLLEMDGLRETLVSMTALLQLRNVLPGCFDSI
jgi:hypothetical protein